MRLSELPLYDELPELGQLKIRHSWGHLPMEKGTLAFIDTEQVLDGASLVVSGKAVPLNLGVNAFDPPLFGRDPIEHAVVETSRNEAEDVIGRFNPQASSQLDGLGHVRAREYGYYGGITDLDEARKRLGMHHWATSGIVGRGVLLDVARFRAERDGASDPFSGFGYTPALLRETAQWAGVELRAGDVLLVRTGWVEAYLALNAADRQATLGWDGLHAGEATARFLWDARIALVGSDNPAVENGPGDPQAGSLHRRLLPSLGMSLMELLDLKMLGEQCRAQEKWEFQFVAVPLNLPGAVSSPANAMAIL
ncbi:cyclase family protein [Arthrobacter sp. CC3]|uniref:cyclase family protein n=1 Tax=Arthrobacter sp. CC3 TaxID=3029185 RepID=UPI003263B68B